MLSSQLRRSVPVYQKLLISSTVPTLFLTATRATALSARSRENGGPWHAPVTSTWKQDRCYAISRQEPRQVRHIMDVLSVYASGRRLRTKINQLEGDAKVHLDVTAKTDMALIPAYATLLDLTMKMVADANPPELWNQSQNGETFRQQFPESLRSTVKWMQNNSRALKPPSSSVTDLAQLSVKLFEKARDSCLEMQDHLARIQEQIMGMQHEISVFNIELQLADKLHPQQKKMFQHARDNAKSRQAYAQDIWPREDLRDAKNDAKQAQALLNLLNKFVQPAFDKGELKSLGDEVSILFDRTITQKDILERILTGHVREMANMAHTWFRPVFHHRFTEKILEILALAPLSAETLPYVRGVLALLSWPGTQLLTPDTDSLARWRRRPQVQQSSLKGRLGEIVERAEGERKKFPAGKEEEAGAFGRFSR
ncbi:hypothetical protein SBOR_1710 [Sclerotinia borealis F-4128]|uniref:Uncharacterized protein n=1 Tax=Sclerotinia borealis (strain F-4128) TaxID=1432307 RepID=W9CQ02_SCLBF|nr:hypothetical protein SBOR_1710 [Sclerotinia borealis F-4128]